MPESNADKVRRVLRDNANSGPSRLRSRSDERDAHLKALEKNRGSSGKGKKK